jgi:hypothetical protein
MCLGCQWQLHVSTLMGHHYSHKTSFIRLSFNNWYAITLQGVTHHVYHIRPSVRASAPVAIRAYVEGLSSAWIRKDLKEFVNAGYNGTQVFVGAKSGRNFAEINKNVNFRSSSCPLSLTVLEIIRQDRAGSPRLLKCENIVIFGAL